MGGIVIEKKGTLPSGKYFVTFNTMGNRCGYVEVGNRTFKLLHSEHMERYKMIVGDSFEEIMGASRRFKYNSLSRQLTSLYVDRLNVHGGVTFVGNMSELVGLDTNANVVGFDYAHLFDGIDEKAYMKYFPDRKRFFDEIKRSRRGDVATIKDVEEQCKLLESQLRGKEQLLERLDKVRKAKAWRGTKRTKRTWK